MLTLCNLYVWSGGAVAIRNICPATSVSCGGPLRRGRKRGHKVCRKDEECACGNRSAHMAVHSAWLILAGPTPL